MRSKQVDFQLTMLVLVLAFDCGNCNTQEIRKVLSVRSKGITSLDDSESSVLHRDSRSVHRSRRSILNPTQMQQAIDDHNKLRRLISGAADMEIMTWSNDLAVMADNWAQRCIFDHSTDREASRIGQNIYATSGLQYLNITNATQEWFDERLLYNYDTDECTPKDKCGHYTQMVWGTSQEVGCAYSNCTQLTGWSTNAALILVCDYRPGGNIRLQKPYQTGTGCSKCASGSWWCNEGLCDRSCNTAGPTCGCAPVCLNFATVNSANCSCSCVAGWYGSDCSVVCEDKDSMCSPIPGPLYYPSSYCTDSVNGPTVRQKCPRLCNVCTAAADGNNYSVPVKPSALSMLLIGSSWLLIDIFLSV